ncbi:hypothetical protein O181_119870 [Austropuccinia psidii MF-1]|uniref:Uncharacterized protein n=1 Tax=Austropuccinia psidii MF-1 TaxID=1389203 RepID=A0A9Q3KEU1_9BASI|nr:hypothetical protein [Austropuccinia psidii MF-1]
MKATKKNKKCCNFDGSKDALDQGDEIINLEVSHNDNEAPKPEAPLISPQNIQASQDHEKLQYDIMSQDMNDIAWETEPKVANSTNDQGCF